MKFLSVSHIMGNLELAAAADQPSLRAHTKHCVNSQFAVKTVLEAGTVITSF